MGLMDQLFGKKKSNRGKTDSVFGAIEYETNLWTSIPTSKGRRFMIVIVAPESGPSDTQRKFYSSLSERLNEVEQHAKQFIAKQGKVEPSSLSIYSIEIGDDPKTNENSFVLELSDEQADEIHRVEFINGVPSSYGVDS